MKRKTISKLHLVYLIAVIPFCYSSCKLLNNSDNQEKYGNSEQSLHIMFYNVENLFDTLDDPRTNDNDFLPNGSYNWHSYRYYDKLNKIAKVVLATGGWDDIDLIGLCEIENRKVLDDLVFHTPLKSNKYEIIHKESPDRRGIDVALLYSRDKFKPIYYAFTKIIFPFDSSIRTRDILYAKGVVLNRDTLHLFVNHWPSRRGGKEVSEKRRVYVASVLREKVDSILKHNASSNIVIMGDFNDEPMDRSIQEILNAGFDSIDFTSSNLY
ncbi:MAG: hypothetical protein HOA61_11765, partial [Bacteroidetes bacterium]|nr:hypothetical protein [Bacteroidota bacterium]